MLNKIICYFKGHDWKIMTFSRKCLRCQKMINVWHANGCDKKQEIKKITYNNAITYNDFLKFTKDQIKFLPNIMKLYEFHNKFYITMAKGNEKEVFKKQNENLGNMFFDGDLMKTMIFNGDVWVILC